MSGAAEPPSMGGSLVCGSAVELWAAKWRSWQRFERRSPFGRRSGGTRPGSVQFSIAV